MVSQKCRRVKVWNGDKTKYLGEGVLVGEVNIYGVFVQQHGQPVLKTNPDPTKMPDLDALPKDAKIHKSKSPKIQLDSGEIAYGCQTWWQAIPEEMPEPCMDTLYANASAAADKYMLN